MTVSRHLSRQFDAIRALPGQFRHFAAFMFREHAAEMDKAMDEFLESMRRDYGANLTGDQHLHICGVIERFAVNAYRKYCRGVAEHGGGLLAKPVLHEMRDESIDLFIYSDTAIQQSNMGGVVPEPGWVEGQHG